MIKNEINIPELGDYEGTLEDFKNSIDILIEQYGKDSLIFLEAGHNNVSVIIGTK